MSVRWKPMILLTAVFVVLAAAGLFAFTKVLFPARAEDLLPLARAEVKAHKYDRAEIQYKRALQRDPKNAAIHLELAKMIAEWSETQPAQRAKLRSNLLGSLQEAAKHGPQLAEPRRILLADALAGGEWGDCVYWATQLAPLDTNDLDAHYVLAAEALESNPADVAVAQKHLQAIEPKQPNRVRTAWLRARLAEARGETETLATLLTAARAMPRDGSGEDRLCGARLRLMDLEHADDLSVLAERVAAFRTEAAAIVQADLPPARGREVMKLIERMQRHLNTARRDAPEVEALLAPIEASLAELAESTYQQAVKSSQGADLRPHQSYAELLLYRNQRARCAEVVADALALPVAKTAFWIPTAMELREIGIKAALADSNDAKRFDMAGGWIKELIASGTARYRAIGHLFAGVIELERSSLGAGALANSDKPLKIQDSTQVVSALVHLKQAADELQDVPTAQALYGVGLVLSGEAALGRQYLQRALRDGGSKLDPRYQVWAALSVMQAGYPEDAEPVVDNLLKQIEAGAAPAALAATLHLIKAEIHQARESPSELRLAQGEFQKALQAGLPNTPALELRMAHLAAMLGDPGQAFDAINRLSGDAESGAAAERVAALTLYQQGKADQAIARINEAIKKHPDSPELAELAAALHVQAGQAEAADALLSTFLAAHPDHEDLSLLRAKILAESLKRPDEASKLVQSLCEKSKNSAPWILRAHLELSKNDTAAATKVIAQIRTRWPDAAAADLLDAQVSLARTDLPAAKEHLAAALKKDPNNKVALFWRGRLEELTGSSTQAQAIFEQIARERPLKEIDSGLPLGTAAQWALAAMALEHQQFDLAVSRYEGLLRDAPSDGVARPARWNLAIARAAKGQVNEAKADILTLVRDPKTTPDERVQAADFLRRHGDLAGAAAQIDLALKATPNHPGAVTYRALLLLDKNQVAEAGALVKKAIAAGNAPQGLYLLIAAIENQSGPSGMPRAKAALDEGLQVHADSSELYRARYQIMSLMKDPDTLSVLEKPASLNPASAAASVLTEAYRERGEFEKALNLIAERQKVTDPASPAGKQLIVQQITLSAARAAKAADAGDPNAARKLLADAERSLTEVRKADPSHLPYLELEGELALQARDFARARRLADELSQQDKSGAAGPLLSARIAGAEGKPQEVTRAYTEAVERSPGRSDLRLALAQAHLSGGEFDAAVRQASAVLDADRESPAAQYLKAQALARAGDSPEEMARNRAQAAELLKQTIAKTPSYLDAYHLLSDMYVLLGKRNEAIALLKTCLQQEPGDEAAFSLLVQRLAEPATPGKEPAAASLQEAEALVAKRCAGDTTGDACLAAAVGFHRAGQSSRALPWAEKAAELRHEPAVQLTVGDILLACAEGNSSSAESRAWFEQALMHYDRVLAARPNSIEAVNNKAWILHRYLGRNSEALQLVEPFASGDDAARLPADFHDTIGSIQEAAGKLQDAETSYARGLRVAPDHPILNFHMGRLLKQQHKSAFRANACLEKAKAALAELPPDLRAEVEAALADTAN